MYILFLICLLSVVICGLGVVSFLFWKIHSISVEDGLAKTIALAIRVGAMTFLREEYTIILYAMVAIGILLALGGGLLAAMFFLLGAFLSMLTGFVGMFAATAANVRTAIAARSSGERGAFLTAFCGGGVMGFAVASLGLLGASIVFFYFFNHPSFVTILTSFSLGGSFVAFFARVGGGIYTKSADVGADLVGKIEMGIPEDDARNPAVIADNVGDCVGDTAGMGADIYESYVGAMVSTMIIGYQLYGSVSYVLLPMGLAAIGLCGSAVGMFTTMLFRVKPVSMLLNATYIAIAVLLFGAAICLYVAHLPFFLFNSILFGCLAGIFIGLITEYYTSGNPVKKIAENSLSGAGTNVIYGLSVGMESTVAPVIILSGVVLLAYMFGGGLYGVALAAVAMLATVGITMTVDAYGPIADNAGGIAQMAGFDGAVRVITDKLDSLGNTTAAMGKGFAIGSAMLTAMALFSAYSQQAGLGSVLNIIDPVVLMGLFIGAVMPFIISALLMRSVSTTAMKIVLEVRRQFKEIPGLLQGTADPDYKRCVSISAKAALREMILPGVLTIGVPVLIKYLFGSYGVQALGGLLVGSMVTGVLLALMMANAGGAWDNAKKYIEAGHLGGKGSETYKAAVVGDTVGDPFKDTAGPALNILIKLMAIVALLLASI